MRFEELQDSARKLLRVDALLETRRQRPTAVADNLRSLALDARFAAVIALLMRDREMYVKHGSSTTLAPHHGPLAHCQGGVSACDRLLGAIEEMMRPAPKGGAKRPADAEEG
jgi:hypothetical protein